jgi:hypothetical protein
LSALHLQDALADSELPAAQLAAQLLRAGEARATTQSVSYDDLISTLRVRRDIKRDQAASGEPNVVKLRDALEVIVEWWDANPHEHVLYDDVSSGSAVCFLFWRQATTGIVLAGFETRDATKLTEAEGRRFWGAGWRPPYSGI